MIYKTHFIGGKIKQFLSEYERSLFPKYSFIYSRISEKTEIIQKNRKLHHQNNPEKIR